ncbi:MAG: hypothetical protein AAB965_01925 [Patescibacteria group bacterium]
MDKTRLKELLLSAWCAETAQGKWTPECPSMIQCAVTALVVQDYFGGEMLRCKMTDGDSHYWNRLPDGNEEDWTEEQFDYIEAQPIKSEYIVREREYVLSFPNTKMRYDLLKEKVERLSRKQTL